MQWNRWRVENLHKVSTSNLIGANFEVLKRYYKKMCAGTTHLARNKCM